jgi:hypothetical protein
MNSAAPTFSHPFFEREHNSLAHIENQVNKRLEFLDAQKSKKINLKKESPVFQTKKKNFVDVNEELDGEGYFMSVAAEAGHVEIPR